MTIFAQTIDGGAAAAMSTFPVIDPATGEVCSHAPSCDAAQLDAAMEAARLAQPCWAADEARRRAALSEMAARLVAEAGNLAPVLTMEQGKPLADARWELENAALWLRYYAAMEMPHEVVADDQRGRVEVFRRPVGVVAAITPWNYPVMLSVWKIAPALRAGNTMVLKPSPYTPLTVLALGELFRPVLPPGVLNVVTGPEPLGRRVIAHPVPSKVAFTGSTATGRRVGAAAIADLKRVTLELGGNDAAVVLDDAEPERFSESVFWGAMRNNGQLCLALKRLYVPARRHAAWVEALAARAERTRVGDGRDAGTELGPVGNAAQHRRVQDLVEAAVRDGATVAAGGRSLDRAGYFYAPTILADVTDAMRVVREEQFGPVLPVLAYDDVDEAVERANASDYGLTGSVWSDDEEHAAAIAARLRCGQVSINVHGGAVRPDTPFHGFRHSGIGVENGRAGLDAYTELQAIARSG